MDLCRCGKCLKIWDAGHTDFKNCPFCGAGAPVREKLTHRSKFSNEEILVLYGFYDEMPEEEKGAADGNAVTAEGFLDFPEGTPVEDIDRWFEDNFTGPWIELAASTESNPGSAKRDFREQVLSHVRLILRPEAKPAPPRGIGCLKDRTWCDLHVGVTFDYADTDSKTLTAYDAYMDGLSCEEVWTRAVENTKRSVTLIQEEGFCPRMECDGTDDATGALLFLKSVRGYAEALDRKVYDGRVLLIPWTGSVVVYPIEIGEDCMDEVDRLAFPLWDLRRRGVPLAGRVYMYSKLSGRETPASVKTFRDESGWLIERVDITPGC